MNDLLTGFKRFYAEKELFAADQKILLAVSGGIDSVVMCELFYKAGISFGIAHCNFSLRGAESNEDEQFVKQLAERYGAKFFAKRFDTAVYAHKKGISIQMAARELRYQWFMDLLKKSKYTAVALAQHQDDVVETMLINLVRGTGVDGMHGILASSQEGKLIRPLLFTNRNGVDLYAQQHQLKWREDSSNKEDKYTRNKLRLHIVPVLKEINPSLSQTFVNNAGLFYEAALIVKQHVKKVKNELVIKKRPKIFISIAKLKKQPAIKSVLFALFSEFNFAAAQMAELLDLCKSQTGKRVQSNSHVVYRDRDQLVVQPIDVKSTFKTIKIKTTDKKIDIIGVGKLTIRKMSAVNFKIDRDPNVACLDLDKLQFPLTIRPWKAGDRFRPLGMKQSKKMSDFLTDEKVPAYQKQNTLVIQSAGEIVWVPGCRISDRYKINEHTRKIIKIAITN